jgi:photosystem II stability/assembly factor-like uncharacterized protein
VINMIRHSTKFFILPISVIAFVALVVLVTFVTPASASWVQQDHGTLQSLRAIAKTDGALVAGGNTGFIMRSTDDGETWAKLSQFSNVWWQDMETEQDNDVVAVGDGGSYAVSSDGGATWASYSLGVSANLFDVDRNGSYGYIAGAGGTLLYLSQNYGNWISASTNVSETLYAVYDMGDGTAWAGGGSGRLLRVTNGGTSFANLGRVVTDNIRGIYFASSTNGWIVGEKGTFKKTTDGGTSWTSVSVSGLVLQDLYDIQANGDTIVIVGDKIIIRSDDGGATWNAEDFTDSNATFYAVALVRDEAWAAGTDYDVKSVVYHFDVISETEELEEPDEDSDITAGENDTPEAQQSNLIKIACIGETNENDPCRAVYYYADDGKRHAFPNERVYFTWFEDFDDVIEVSLDFMSDIPLGSNVTYHPGAHMVKFQTTRTVYVVSRAGVLRPLASESVAGALYGLDWNQQIDDISDSFFSDYSFGESVDVAEEFDLEMEWKAVDGLDDNF